MSKKNVQPEAVFVNAAQALENGDEAAAKAEYQKLNRDLRGLIACVAAAAAGRTMNNSDLAALGRFDRAAFTSKNSPTNKALATKLDLQRDFVPPVVKWLLKAKSDRTAAELQAELQQRDQTIADLRQELQAERDGRAEEKAVATAYLAAVHQKAWAQHQADVKEREEKVLDIGPRIKSVPTPEETSDDDDE